MSKGAMATKFAFSFRQEKLAYLCLVIAVRNIHHLHHQFSRQGLYLKNKSIKTKSICSFEIEES